MIETLFNKSAGGGLLTFEEVMLLAESELDVLMSYAEKLKLTFIGSKPETCAIINARSGLCSENCAFCAQSSHFSTGAPVYDYIDLKKIHDAAKDLAERGVERFSIVTSGLAPDDAEFEKIIESIRIINSHGLKADASVGCLSHEKLFRLKEAGLSAYHHNLEVSRSFFPEICTTHSYDDDVQTVKNAVELGLYVCCGGIFGLGEGWLHRYELAVTLKELGVSSVPVNFLNPIKGTPKEGASVLSEEEALRIIAVLRFVLPEKSIRICGGRSIVFSRDSALKCLKAGASGVMVGDYLTVKGISFDDDMKFLK